MANFSSIKAFPERRDNGSSTPHEKDFVTSTNFGKDKKGIDVVLQTESDRTVAQEQTHLLKSIVKHLEIITGATEI